MVRTASKDLSHTMGGQHARSAIPISEIFRKYEDPGKDVLQLSPHGARTSQIG